MTTFDLMSRHLNRQPSGPRTRTRCARRRARRSSCPTRIARVDAAHNQVGLAIAAFEGSSEVNVYTSKYDYLAGLVKLSKEERQGLALFNSMKAKCSACHILDGGPNGEPLFTDFTFDNLGIPINPENPAYIADRFIDPGLGGFLATRPE